jgi:Lamin Tail Domain
MNFVRQSRGLRISTVASLVALGPGLPADAQVPRIPADRVPPALREPTETPAPAAKPAANPRSAGEPARSNTRAIAYPHPLITEVLYAVPPGLDGDANKDGVRSATGDEFIELVNPHARPIQLVGYSLTDDAQTDKGKLRFTFPALELKPGERVVVFNGYGCSWSETVGDTKAAAAKPSMAFDGASVFSMRVTGNRTALNNAGDVLSLLTPANKPVHRLRWGTAAATGASEPGVLDETLPDATRSSVQRAGVNPGDAWRLHTEFSKAPHSPGAFDADLVASAPADGPPGEAVPGTTPKNASPNRP